MHVMDMETDYSVGSRDLLADPSEGAAIARDSSPRDWQVTVLR